MSGVPRGVPAPRCRKPKGEGKTRDGLSVYSGAHVGVSTRVLSALPDAANLCMVGRVSSRCGVALAEVGALSKWCGVDQNVELGHTGVVSTKADKGGSGQKWLGEEPIPWRWRPKLGGFHELLSDHD